MKTVDERIENLSDDLLDRFTNSVCRIDCGNLLCFNCPIQTDSGCLCVKLYEERDKRKRKARTNEETVPTPNTELEAKAQELVEQLGHLVELLSKF